MNFMFSGLLNYLDRSNELSDYWCVPPSADHTKSTLECFSTFRKSIGYSCGLGTWYAIMGMVTTVWSDVKSLTWRDLMLSCKILVLFWSFGPSIHRGWWIMILVCVINMPWSILMLMPCSCRLTRMHTVSIMFTASTSRIKPSMNEYWWQSYGSQAGERVLDIGRAIMMTDRPWGDRSTLVTNLQASVVLGWWEKTTNQAHNCCDIPL